MKSPAPLKKILSAKSSRLQPLMRQITTLQQLNARLRQLLPTPLSQHCQIAALEQETLVIVTTSPAWATRLRLQRGMVVKGFQDLNVKSVRIQTEATANNSDGASAMIKKQPRPMSSNTSNLLIDLAETTSDPRLSAALRRLSRHARK